MFSAFRRSSGSVMLVLCLFGMYLQVYVFLLVKEIACERECSRGEDYRLIKLTITDYNVKTYLLPVIFYCCFDIGN